MNINFNNRLAFGGKIICKGSLCAVKLKNYKSPFNAEESIKLIGTPDFAGESDNEPSSIKLFPVDTKRITGIDSCSIHFASDDNIIQGALSYQPKIATEVQKKLNYIAALNAYNIAHQNDIETEIAF